MLAGNKIPAGNKTLVREVEARIPCDCHSVDCNPKQQDFEHRQLAGGRKPGGRTRKANTSDSTRGTPSWQYPLGTGRQKTKEQSGSQC